MSHDPPKLDDAELFPSLDGEPGPAGPLSSAEADAVAWSVVSRFTAAAPGVDPADAEDGPAILLDRAAAERVANAVARKHGRRFVSGVPWRSAAAVLLACMFGGVAFAALRTFVAPAPVAVPSVATQAARARPSHAPASVPAPAPVAPTPAPAPPDPVAETATPAPAHDGHDARLDSAELLARANGLRARHDWQGAEQLYQRVVGMRSASSHDRYVATLAAAGLAVQHTGAPRRGLALYQRALALEPAGDLAEEARFGVAQAQRALGNRPAEAAALHAFLDRYPHSVSAPGARERLASIPP